MGHISEHPGLLRILLADEDDANAFLFQCGVNRLGRPCAFQRVNSRKALPEKFEMFRPNILIAAGAFAQPDQLKEIKQFTNGHPIICAVETPDEGDAALAAGATDCVLKTQVDELHACIEWHLSGRKEVPHFKKNFAPNSSTRKTKGPSNLDLKLAEFDRWVGSKLRKFAAMSHTKARKLARVANMASVAAVRELRRRYKELKVQWLLHRQKKLIQSNPGGNSGSSGSFSPIAPIHRGTEPQASEKIRIIAPTKPSAPTPESSSIGSSSDNDSLRTLELSFKTLFHTSMDAVLLLDGLGSILHANGPACALLAITPADLLGKMILEFVPVPERPQVSVFWEALLIEGQQKAEFHLQSKTGDVRDVFVSARSNLWFGIHLLIVRDQTEIKALRGIARSNATQGNLTTPLQAHAAPESSSCAQTQAP